MKISRFTTVVAIAFCTCALPSCITTQVPDQGGQTRPEEQEDETPMPGGYSSITEWGESANEAASLAQQAVRQQYGVGTTVEKGRAQVVAGMNYEITLRSQTTPSRYVIVVHQALGNAPMRVLDVSPLR